MTPMIVKSFTELKDKPVNALAYCETTLMFEKVRINKRQGKAPRVTFIRDGKPHHIVATKKTQKAWLNVDTLPLDGGYVKMPTVIAARIMEGEINA